MGLLIVSDILQLIVEGGRLARGGEFLQGPLGESGLVEGVLEMLKLQGISRWIAREVEEGLTVKAYCRITASILSLLDIGAAEDPMTLVNASAAVVEKRMMVDG